jgi:hypothetical protein
MRLLALVLVATLVAGCATLPGATTTEPTVPAPRVVASGATLSTVGSTTFVSWKGSLTPPQTDPVTGSPLPGRATPLADEAFTIPPDTTLLVGWLNWTGASVLSLHVLNDSGRSVCGEAGASEAPAMCFMTLYTPLAKAFDWKARVSLDGGATTTPFSLTLAFSATKLPILGSPAPFGSGAPLVFDTPVLVDKDRHTGEPSLALAPKGTVYVSAPTGAQQSLWRSTDGKTFQWVPIHGTTSDPLSSYPLGGGDSDVAVATDSTLYFADQQGGSGETVSTSHDGGATWTTQPLAAGPAAIPGSPVPTPVPLPGVPTGAVYSADRQWLVTDGDMTAWMAFNSAQGATVVKSVDGGKTWPLRAYMMEDACFRGNLARAPDGTLYYAGCNEHGPGVGVSTDGGLTFTWHQVAERSGKTNTSFLFAAHIFDVVTTDAKGNAYVVWSDEAATPNASAAPPGVADPALNVWMSSTTDKGATWSLPKKVNQGPGDYVLPWATGGAAGHLAVAFYGTKFAGNPERAMGEWYPLVAETDDATADQPTWHEAAMSPDLVQYGPICMRGSACGGQRNLLDFFQIQSDQQGLLHAAFVDGRAGISARLSDILYAQQSGGMTLGGPSVDKRAAGG